MKKRFLAGALAAVLVLTAGCARAGSRDDPAPTKPTAAPTEPVRTEALQGTVTTTGAADDAGFTSTEAATTSTEPACPVKRQTTTWTAADGEHTSAPTEPVPAPTEPVRRVTLQDALAAVQPATHYDWADSLPRMDGSTSTIPLEAGIRAALFGTSIAEAETQVKHSTTWGSFYNLIEGRCDLIFSVPLSAKQITEAREKNIELEMTKVAAEGFVFVVNAKNPVNALSQQQLRDIYSGKITNWAQVGGNDAAIVAYQRNEDSGSQNFMHTFMGDTPLMDPLTSAQFTPDGMGSLMDAVASYDNAENAIGYSVYAYAADMYGNGNEIKFIHVDGVAPNKATMSDGSYPLLSYNYAVYNKATAADAPLRKLVEWIATDEGQRAVKAAGYVPLRPVGEAEETAIRLYSAVGTGPEKPANHTVPAYYYTLQDNEYACVSALKNEKLKAEISAFVEKSTADMKKGHESEITSSYTRLECINGYMSVNVCAFGDERFDHRVAIYDLVAGKRIAFSDLFYQGEAFVDRVNAQVQRAFWEKTNYMEAMGEGAGPGAIKREFIGLPAGYDAFTLTSVQFPADNFYVYDPNSFSVSLCELGDKMAMRDLRDMQGVFDDRVTVEKRMWKENGWDVMEALLPDNHAVELLDVTHYDAAVAEKVNESMRTLCRDSLNTEAMEQWLADTYGLHGLFREADRIDLSVLGDRYFLFTSSMLYVASDGWKNLDFGVIRLFDKETGEAVPYTALLKDGWETHSRWTAGGPYTRGEDDAESQSIAVPSLSDASLYYLITQEGETWRLTFGLRHPDLPSVTAEVPAEYVNWELN